MKKIISTTILCLIICVLPLIFEPALIFNGRFLVILFFFYLLFFTQPAFAAEDIKRASDKNSMLFITIGLVLSLSGSIADWAYFHIAEGLVSDRTLMLSGLTLLIAGAMIRIWAIVELGKYFSNSVTFTQKHKLITSGPYKLIRHPSYLGAYMAIIGSALFLGSIPFSVIAAAVMLMAYLYRIKVEEIGLNTIFPGEYAEYKKHTKMILPYIH